MTYQHKRRYCSFCGKECDEVRLLVAGPGNVFICNECIEVCNAIWYTKHRAGELEYASWSPAPL